MNFFLSLGQMNDTENALVQMYTMPSAKVLLCNESYIADWFLEALEDKWINVCLKALHWGKSPDCHE